jgi:hypothetical protein
MDAGLRWRKSVRSGSACNCVEVAYLPRGGIALRDSKDRSAAPLFFTGEEWAAFIAGVKDGEFDLPAAWLTAAGSSHGQGSLPCPPAPLCPLPEPAASSRAPGGPATCTIRH